MMARYSAMGDSIPAGRGLSQMESGTCSSSDLAYPAKIGSQKGLLVDNLACSGATMLNVAVYQVGQAFAGSSPQLITIQAGANDVKWQDFLRKCYFATCGTEFDTQTASRLLAKLASSTSAALNAIDQQSGGVPPQVRVIGYYNPLPPGCNRLEPRITKSELAWINSETAALNQTLENASRNFSFASFAPLDFSGHELYTSDPWVQNWRDPAPLHPNEEGQQAIAQQVN